MEFERLKLNLKEAVKQYLAKDFDYFMEMDKSLGKINEQIDEGACQVECSVMQHYEDEGENWLEVVIYVSDDDMEIGANIVFHINGDIEVPEKVRLHRFDGLPREIAELRLED
jgi:hypothetical protein